MKSICLIPILLLVVVLCSSNGSAMRVQSFKYRRNDPNNPYMCTLKNNEMLRVENSIRNPNGECELLNCHENGMVSIIKCAPQLMREGCTLGQVINPNVMYPHCCKREIKCKTDYFP